MPNQESEPRMEPPLSAPSVGRSFIWIRNFICAARDTKEASIVSPYTGQFFFCRSSKVLPALLCATVIRVLWTICIIRYVQEITNKGVGEGFIAMYKICCVCVCVQMFLNYSISRHRTFDAKREVDAATAAAAVATEEAAE